MATQPNVKSRGAPRFAEESGQSITQVVTYELRERLAAVRISAEHCVEAGIDIDAVPPDHARIGRQAFRRFGKGYHDAALNHVDCFADTLARIEVAPLLYTGDDFARTDIATAAWR